MKKLFLVLTLVTFTPSVWASHVNNNITTNDDDTPDSSVINVNGSDFDIVNAQIATDLFPYQDAVELNTLDRVTVGGVDGNHNTGDTTVDVVSEAVNSVNSSTIDISGFENPSANDILSGQIADDVGYQRAFSTNDLYGVTVGFANGNHNTGDVSLSVVASGVNSVNSSTISVSTTP